MNFTDYEVNKLKRVNDEHRKTCKADLSVDYASGGGIGTRVICTCHICKKEYDITDYASW